MTDRAVVLVGREPLLYDVDGKEAVTADSIPESCGECGSHEIEVMQPGFGGYWKAVCKKGDHVVASGREVA